MGWIRKQEPGHDCVKPPLYDNAIPWMRVENAHPGDVWECDECGGQWKVAVGVWGTLEFVPVVFKRRLKERSRKR